MEVPEMVLVLPSFCYEIAVSKTFNFALCTINVTYPGAQNCDTRSPDIHKRAVVREGGLGVVDIRRGDGAGFGC
jgi:hypothetical protein